MPEPEIFTAEPATIPPAALIRVVNLTPTKLKGALTVPEPFLVASRPETESKVSSWANV